MSETDRPAGVQSARRQLDEALRGMEQFIMNLDPGRVQPLRDWLRTAAADAAPDRVSAPPLDGLPLAERITEHVEAVLSARTAWRKAGRLA